MRMSLISVDAHQWPSPKRNKRARKPIGRVQRCQFPQVQSRVEIDLENKWKDTLGGLFKSSRFSWSTNEITDERVMPIFPFVATISFWIIQSLYPAFTYLFTCFQRMITLILHQPLFASLKYLLDTPMHYRGFSRLQTYFSSFFSRLWNKNIMRPLTCWSYPWIQLFFLVHVTPLATSGDQSESPMKNSNVATVQRPSISYIWLK